VFKENLNVRVYHSEVAKRSYNSHIKVDIPVLLFVYAPYIISPWRFSTNFILMFASPIQKSGLTLKVNLFY